MNDGGKTDTENTTRVDKLLNQFKVETFFDTDEPIEGVTTSFGPETSEVLSYIEEIKMGDASAVYEFLQNAFDYNNYCKGNPEVTFFFKDGQKISLWQLIKLSKNEIEMLANEVEKVEISNWIDEDKLFEIEHLTSNRHAGVTDTLGKHGRGGKASPTALIDQGCISNMEVSSRGEDGPWRARGEVGINRDLFKHQKTPSYNVLYQSYSSTQKIEKTIVTLNNPDFRLLEMFKKLSNKFLLVNPKYFGSADGDEMEQKPEKEENLLSFWFGPVTFSGKNNIEATAAEKELLSLSEGKAEYTQSPRVEILPNSFIRDQKKDAIWMDGESSDCVFVDGLRLSTSKNYALQWSFWGCDHGDKNKGYFIERSSESRYPQGNWNELMELTLSKCTNPLVFKTIFKKIANGTPIKEDYLSSKKIIDYLAASPEMAEAFTTAWTEFLVEEKIDPEILFTGRASTQETLAKRDISTYLFNSFCWFKVLADRKMIEVAENKIRLDEKPSETGDIMKVPSGSISLDAAVDRLFGVAIEEDNKVYATNNELYLRLSYPKDEPPKSFHHLPATLGQFVKDFYSYCGSDTAIEITFDTGNEESMRFVLDSDCDYWERMAGVASVKVNSGKITTMLSSGESGFILIKLKSSGEKENDQLKNLIKKFMEVFHTVSSDGESIDLDMFAENYSGLERGVFDTKIMEQKREMLKMMKKMEEERREYGIVPEDANSLDATRKSLRISKKTPRSFTTLFSPDSAPRARNIDHKRDEADVPTSQKGMMEMIRILVEYADSLKNPDIHLLNPGLIPAYSRTTLVTNINPFFSGETSYDEHSVPFSKDDKKTGIRVNQRIVAGSHAVPSPLDCELVGFYHPDPNFQSKIRLSASLEKNMFAFESDEIVPPGLEFYFSYNPENSINTPATEMEKEELLDHNFLPPPWFGLVDGIRNDASLSEKQKADIILSAWLHAFTYDDDLEINNQVLEETQKLVDQGLTEESARYIAMITVSKGNCGFGSEGFLPLARAVGLESSEAIGYLGDNGKFFPGPHNHGIVTLKINGNWTYVEAQRGYLSSKLSIERIPSVYKAMIRGIPKGIRNYSNRNVARENTGIREIIDELRKRKLAGDPSIREILAEISNTMRSEENEYSSAWKFDPALDSIEDQEPNIEQVIRFLAEQPDLNDPSNSTKIDFDDLSEEQKNKLMESFFDFLPASESKKMLATIKKELKEKEEELALATEKLKNTKVYANRLELKILNLEERANEVLGRLNEQITLTKKEKMYNRIIITGSIILIVSAMFGAQAIGEGIAELQTQFQSSPINIGNIISKAFAPELTSVAKIMPSSMELLKAIINPTAENPLPIFSIKDILSNSKLLMRIGGPNSIGAISSLLAVKFKNRKEIPS